MNKSKLAIFDMDGTLFDTGYVNFCSYRQAANEFGFEIKEDMFFDVFVGKNYKEFLPHFGIIKSEDLTKIHIRKKEIYTAYLDKAIMNEGIFDIIKGIKKEYIIALATTASKKNTLDIINYFNVKDLFEIIITQEDVENLKPNPECYKKAMKMAKVNPQNTIIFEDSEVGIKAAYESGAQVFRVENFQK